MLFEIFICFTQALYVPVLANNAIAYLEAEYIKEINIAAVQADFNRVFDSLVAIEVPAETAEIKALNSILEKLDPYSRILSPDVMKGFQGGEACVGLSIIKDSFGIRITQIIEDGPAYESGIKSGDYIISIDDRSTLNHNMTDILGYLRGEPETTIKIEIVKCNKKDTIVYRLQRKKSVYLQSQSIALSMGISGIFIL